MLANRHYELLPEAPVLVHLTASRLRCETLWRQTHTVFDHRDTQIKSRQWHKMLLHLHHQIRATESTPGGVLLVDKILVQRIQQTSQVPSANQTTPIAILRAFCHPSLGKGSTVTGGILLS